MCKHAGAEENSRPDRSVFRRSREITRLEGVEAKRVAVDDPRVELAGQAAAYSTSLIPPWQLIGLSDHSRHTLHCLLLRFHLVLISDVSCRSVRRTTPISGQDAQYTFQHDPKGKRR